MSNRENKYREGKLKRTRNRVKRTRICDFKSSQSKNNNGVPFA